MRFILYNFDKTQMFQNSFKYFLYKEGLLRVKFCKTQYFGKLNIL